MSLLAGGNEVAAQSSGDNTGQEGDTAVSSVQDSGRFDLRFCVFAVRVEAQYPLLSLLIGRSCTSLFHAIHLPSFICVILMFTGEIEVLGAAPSPVLPEWTEAAPPAVELPPTGESNESSAEKAASEAQAAVTELQVCLCFSLHCRCGCFVHECIAVLPV